MPLEQILNSNLDSQAQLAEYFIINILILSPIIIGGYIIGTRYCILDFNSRVQADLSTSSTTTMSTSPEIVNPVLMNNPVLEDPAIVGNMLAVSEVSGWLQFISLWLLIIEITTRYVIDNDLYSPAFLEGVYNMARHLSDSIESTYDVLQRAVHLVEQDPSSYNTYGLDRSDLDTFDALSNDWRETGNRWVRMIRWLEPYISDYNENFEFLEPEWFEDEF
jgi:hypothetical protein